MEYVLQVIVLALLQGVAELFPVSSLGHTVIIPGILGWGNLTTQESFLPIVVTLHLGTSVALFIFYWRDWLALIRAFFKTARAGRLDADPQGKTVWLIIVGTIPVGLIGLLLEKPIKSIFFQSPWPVLPAAFLCLNGAVLFAAEILRQRAESKGDPRYKQELRFCKVEDLTFTQAFLIGASQSFGLIPGISRSGVTMVAGMRARLSHEESLRFAFLLAAPVIGAAALLEVPKLFKESHTTQLAAVIGFFIATIAAYLSARFLTRYFQTGRLTPFAIYCIVAGLLAFLFFTPLSLGAFHLPW